MEQEHGLYCLLDILVGLLAFLLPCSEHQKTNTHLDIGGDFNHFIERKMNCLDRSQMRATWISTISSVMNTHRKRNHLGSRSSISLVARSLDPVFRISHDVVRCMDLDPTRSPVWTLC